MNSYYEIMGEPAWWNWPEISPECDLVKNHLAVDHEYGVNDYGCWTMDQLKAFHQDDHDQYGDRLHS